MRLHLGAMLMLLHRSVDGLQATSCCDQSLGAFDSNVWHCELRAHAGRPLARSKPAPPASTALRWKTPCLLRLVLQQNEPLTRVLDELVADVLSGGLRDCRSYVGEADRQSSAGHKDINCHAGHCRLHFRSESTASGQDRYSTTATGQHVIGCGSRPRGGVCACWPVAECNQSMKPVHWSNRIPHRIGIPFRKYWGRWCLT